MSHICRITIFQGTFVSVIFFFMSREKVVIFMRNTVFSRENYDFFSFFPISKHSDYYFKLKLTKNLSGFQKKKKHLPYGFDKPITNAKPFIYLFNIEFSYRYIAIFKFKSKS